MALTGEGRFDTDVVVVGSGFGGSVAALRLAEKGYDVLVYEAGRRFEDDDFARTSWDARRFLWAPALGCFGVQRIHRLRDVLVFAGAGVGGGSLNYANTLYVPPPAFFTDPQWGSITDWQAELAPYYQQASRMLGVVTNPCTGIVEEVMRDVAEEMGVGSTFRKTPVGVFFGRGGEREPGVKVPDPFFGGAGPERTGCVECGNCMVGCRYGAKNTLVKNYLALAERLGVRIEAMRTVVAVQPRDPRRPDRGWLVTTVRTGARRRREVRTVTAGQVVLAAGSWGTATLLQTLRADGALPRLSPRLGTRTRTNSEAVVGVWMARVPSADLTKGVAITSSFHPDADTHVENARFGKGSNAMGLLGTVLVDGNADGSRGRWRRLPGMIARDPWAFLRSFSVRRWSERGLIGLVMQSPRQLDHRVRGASPHRPPASGGMATGLAAGRGRAQPAMDSRGPRRDPQDRPAPRGSHRGASRPRRQRERPRGRPGDGASSGRLPGRRDPGRRRDRSLSPRVRLPGPACRRRVRRLGEPRSQPRPHDHRAGRAGLRTLAEPRRGRSAAGPGGGLPAGGPRPAAASGGACPRVGGPVVSDHGWTPGDLPDLTGVQVVVTGANSGLGFFTSLELARHGAGIVLAVRDEARGAEAADRIRAEVPAARLSVARLDLADLASVRAFAAGHVGRSADLLVNNAGVMAIPRRETADGFEVQFGVNHLGHFALTGLLLPTLLSGGMLGGPARVVTVSSGLHRRGRLHRNDLMAQRWYTPFGVYGQSKLANLLFMRELQRRVDGAGVPLTSLAAHPGYAATNLQTRGPRMTGSRVREMGVTLGNRLLAQSAAQGAWPILRAATDAGALGGDYFGPGGFAEQRGHPVLVGMSSAALDADDARWLWARSVELTGVLYEELSPASPRTP
jgi:cholesterol oxidase